MDQECGTRQVKAAKPRGAYETGGPTWAQRATAGEFSAVLDPSGSTARNLYLHHTSLAVAKFALRRAPRPAEHVALLDYGCGTGRFLRYFGSQGYRVLGFDITPEMLAEAERFGLPRSCETRLSDGHTLSLPDSSVSFIWVCGVLKYTLFPPTDPSRGGEGESSESHSQFEPTYAGLAQEMFRVLKPGGCVANLEMYVDTRPEPFLPGFTEAGFRCERLDVVRRENGRFERYQTERVPTWLIPLHAKASVWIRRLLDDANRELVGFRDYLFLWRKP